MELTPAWGFSSIDFNCTAQVDTLLPPVLHAGEHKHPTLNLHGIIMQEAELAFPKSRAGQSLLKGFPGHPI